MIETSTQDPFAIDPVALESEIAEMEATAIDEFHSGMDYDNFIVLQKKDVANLCRIVEPLTKASVDEYGKCFYVRCVDTSTVEICFIDKPEVIIARFENRSGKTVRDFAVQVATLKKVVTSAYASIIFVETEDHDINIALCGTLMYLETKKLQAERYKIAQKNTMKTIDKDVAAYTFRKIGSALTCTESTAERTMVVKNGQVHVNTSVFISKSQSPFEEGEFTIPSRTTTVLSTLSDICKNNLNYELSKDSDTNQETMVVRCDGVYYCELFIGGQDSVEKFLSPVAEQALNFQASVSVINDTFSQLIAMVKALDYLSDIVTIEFTKEQMSLTISTKDHNKRTVLPFPLSGGEPETEGTMNVGVDVLKVFLNLVGKDCLYSFNSFGLGVQNNLGTFLIRKAS